MAVVYSSDKSNDFLYYYKIFLIHKILYFCNLKNY